MLVITVLDRDGKEKKRVVLEDTGTWWFARLFAALLNYTPKGQTETAEVKAEDLSTISITVKSPDGTKLFNNTTNYDSGCIIAIGDAKQYTKRDMCLLLHEIARAPASAEYIQEEGIVSLKATFSFSSNAIIAETGLFFIDGQTGKAVMLDRTYLGEFSEKNIIEVTAGEKVIIEYRLYSQFIV